MSGPITAAAAKTVAAACGEAAAGGGGAGEPARPGVEGTPASGPGAAREQLAATRSASTAAAARLTEIPSPPMLCVVKPTLKVVRST